MLNKYIILILGLVIFESCNSITNISGYYVNRSDSLVKNYLKLNSDMTYLHFYKKGNVTLSQTGRWDFIKSPYIYIELYQFCNFNEKGRSYEKFASYILISDGKYLNNGFDGETSSSFAKE